MPTLKKLQTVHTTWQTTQEKPLPYLPGSPTLTNPDMVLPDGLPTAPSPPRWVRRPPSISYLRDPNTALPDEHDGEARQDKSGSNNRTMMLLRNRPSNRALHAPPSPTYDSPSTFVASSPLLRDVINFLPESRDHLEPPKPDRHSLSGSSGSELSGLHNFLAKYEKSTGNGDDETEADDQSVLDAPRSQSSYELKNDVDAQRRKQQEEEHNSAILSKRAEEILANAKKRLNVMEGNLRGARDLLPLTAANLKRATSLGSGHQYSSSYGPHEYDTSGYEHRNDDSSLSRQLQGKTSSPTMGHDFASHTRGFSATELPDRPHTSFEHPPSIVVRDNVRTSAKTPEPTTPSILRATRSYDILGGSGFSPANALHIRDARMTPDSSYLEPLHEHEEPRRLTTHARNESTHSSIRGLGLTRPSSRTSSIREQMDSLKGRISSLKERAREDSLRRQSMQDLRNSLFNNAPAAAPEFYYQPAHSLREDDNKSSKPSWVTGRGNGALTPTTPATSDGRFPESASLPRGRNAFAEQAALEASESGRCSAQKLPLRTSNSRYQAHKNNSSISGTTEGSSDRDAFTTKYTPNLRTGTPSNSKLHDAFLDDESFLSMPMPDLHDLQQDESPQSSDEQSSDESSGDASEEGYAASEDDASVYEDAQPERPTSVVAHEDRADAFDYQNFLLQSAYARYTPGQQGSDHESDTGSEISASSGGTAKGPSTAQDAEDETHAFDRDNALFLLPAPETPERLREIERNIHQRTYSSESVQTVDTFATADEELHSPDFGTVRSSFGARPYTSHSDYQPRTQPSVRPGTAVKRPSVRRSSSSDRADSGVGLSQRSASNIGMARPRLATVTQSSTTHRYAGSSAVTTPPLSPRTPPPQDPAIIAVNALLNPDGKQLGLRSKAVLFSVMESLRKVALRLQEEDEAQYESRVLRRRLDDAKNALDGVL